MGQNTQAAFRLMNSIADKLAPPRRRYDLKEWKIAAMGLMFWTGVAAWVAAIGCLFYWLSGVGPS
jgi:hypothetical protein